ncbi:MAG: sigma-70 family RNA polymerase sigma factor [Spirochaetes bacterium]|nr:sigma-70 family RNA polymerase sigma factor [Spirochaetota bacterium]
MTDREIYELVRRDRDTGFIMLVQEYQGMVINLAYSYLFDRHEAEDMAQEVFMQAYGALDRFRGESRLSSWLYRICVNRCIDHIRRSKRVKTVPLELVDAATTEGGDGAVREAIADALRTLPGKFRDAVILKDVEGKSYRQIAAILGCSIGTVESRIHRGRKLLRERLSDPWEVDNAM